MREFYEKNKWAIILILASIAVVLAFLLYRQLTSRTTNSPQVVVSIDAPASVSSGGQIVYRVNFANHDTQGIKGLTLDMIYPQGFAFTQSSPDPSKIDGTEFKLPDLDPGMSGSLQITGTLVGNASEVKTTKAVLHYNYAGFNSDFLATAQTQTTVQNSSVLIQFEGPNKTSNNQALNYDVSYSNTSDQDINNVKLKLDLPGVFKVSNYDKNPDSTGVINIGTVPANSSAKFNFSGMFVDAPSGQQQTFNATLSGNGPNNQLLVLGTVSYLVSLDVVPLSLTVTGTTNSGSAVDILNPGDTVSYKIGYKNNSNTAVNNGVITLTLNGQAYDLSTIQAQNATVNNNVITWDASLVSGLSAVAPNQGGNLTVQVRIKNPATKDSSKNLSVSADGNIKSDEYSSGFGADPLVSKIATIVNADEAVSYSSGANPPVAGQTTSYLVKISLRNSTNDVDNAVVTMSLPNASQFDTNSIQGAEKSNVSFNAASKKLTWNVGKLAAHAGEFSALRTLQFTITVAPSASSAGQSLTLVKNLVLQGTDSFTSQKVSDTPRDLSTSDTH